MKRTLICSLFIFFLLIGASRAAEVEAGLFTPYEGPLQLDPLSVNPALVLRQRLVSIRFEILPTTEGQAVILNLFEDVMVRAICDNVEANTSDGFVWMGHIQDLLGSLVTLTVADQALAGTVVLPTVDISHPLFPGPGACSPRDSASGPTNRTLFSRECTVFCGK